MTKTSLLLAAVVAVSLGAFTSVQARESSNSASAKQELLENSSDAAPDIVALDTATTKAK